MTHSQVTATDTRDVFISHRSVDDAWVKRLRDRLELNSCKVWVDDLDTHAGASILGAINSGLERSRYVALVMTPEYFADDAEWTSAEWHAALFTDPDGRRSRVIPLYVRNCPHIPIILNHLNWIDFRDENNFKTACNQLLQALQGRQPRYPVRVAGQIVTHARTVARETLFAERACIDGEPDSVDEHLGCNLLPAITLPQYVWSAPLKEGLGEQTEHGVVFPVKEKLKLIIRDWQDQVGVERPYTPVFTRHRDRVWTLHDLSKVEHPLTAIIEQRGVSQVETSAVLANVDQRKLLSTLLTMCLDRHCYHIGLDKDDKDRFLFPSRNGQEVQRRWRLHNRGRRTVTRRLETEDGTGHFYCHESLYTRLFFLDRRVFLHLRPTVVFSDDGTKHSIWTGLRVGRMAMHWTARPQNIDVFRDLRFWVFQLAHGRDTIRILAGDQSLVFDTRPATVRVHGGIAEDRSNIEELLARLPDSPDWWALAGDASHLQEYREDDE